METVKQLLEKKGNQVWAVAPDESVFRALEIMADKEIGSLMVMDGDQIAGLLSERDYARKIILSGKTSKETPVSAIMTTRVVCVRPELNLQEAMSLVTEKRVRHLPVVDDDDKMIGLISIGDLVKEIISEQQFIIEQLEHYVTS